MMQDQCDDMDVLNVMVGFFFGFSLGVGCALAVMYSIYTGGYRKALSDSLLETKPRRYVELMEKAMAHQRRQAVRSEI
jgi:hypothetical protein